MYTHSITVNDRKSITTNQAAYLEGRRWLSEAIVALAEAQTYLKACGLNDLNATDIDQLLSRAEDLDIELKGADCDKCGHPISGHEDEHGCQRGDHDTERDGVTVASGPCGCGWGSKAVRP